MKELSNITENEVKEICRLIGEPYLDFMTNSDGKWKSLGLEIQISTTSTMNEDNYDGWIAIKKDGTISHTKNDGTWGGCNDERINTLPVIDYLRAQGYEFDYSKTEENE